VRKFRKWAATAKNSVKAIIAFVKRTQTNAPQSANAKSA